MVRKCKTCKNSIAASEKTYCCVGCNQHMHLTTEYTALSNVAINGIKEPGNNWMLMCNTCLDNGERDVFIRCRAQTKVESVISDLKIDEKLSNLENKFSELVDSKLANLISKSCDKIEQKYAKMTAKTLEKAASVVTSSNSKTKVKSEDLNISASFRIQGIAEDPEKTVDENLVPTTEKVKNILQSFNVNTEITSMKRLGKFDKTRIKPRTLLVTVLNEYDKKLIMAKSVENREVLTEESIYFLPALSKADVIKENQVLKKRRELLDEGVPREKLKIRNFELFNDGKKVAMDATELPPKEQSSIWLDNVSVLLLNARSPQNYERRLKLRNAILVQKYNIICITESWLTSDINSAELLMSDFTIYRADRPSTSGKPSLHGGVLIAIRNTYYSEVTFANLPECCLQCTIRVSGEDIVIRVFYSPPHGSPYRYSNDDFVNLIRGTPKRKPVIICGDINFPDTNWETRTSTDSFEQAVIDLLDDLMYDQLINFPTCGSRTLDVAFFSNCIVAAAVDENFNEIYNCSDHLAIRLTIERLTCTEKIFLENFRSFGSADFSSLRDHLCRNPFPPLVFPTSTTRASNYTNILIESLTCSSQPGRDIARICPPG